MRILTADEMAAVDRRSAELGVSVAELMENAGAAVARFVECYEGSAGRYPEHPVVVLCGKGNNGGDGMVAARQLVEGGRAVRVVLFGRVSDLKSPTLENWTRLESLAGVNRREILHEEELGEALGGASLVLDAVLGTGFKPPLRGLVAAARDQLVETKVRVLAVDLPSGWDADATAMRAMDAGKPAAFPADAVVTFVAPKPAHVFGGLTGEQVFGPLVVAGIGTPPEAMPAGEPIRWTGAAKRLTEQPRGLDGNKGKFGHLLLVGGSFGKAGAAKMMSLAALRAGAGLVTAVVSAQILSDVASITPELMTLPIQHAEDGLPLALLEGESLEKLLKGIKVVAIGPGLGQEGSTPEFVRRFVERVSLPMVIDADALNAFAGHTELLKQVAQGKDADGKPRTIVLTPHPGEMARLIGGSVKDVESDRVGLARRFATEYGVTLVLKGWRTLVAHPDGTLAVNTTGNPSMAKGGSGDILTGIVAAMLGQYGEDVPRAVEAAVFLHGLAGDLACLDQDEHTVLATDTVGHLCRAFRSRVADRAGFTWICGTAANGSTVWAVS